MAETTNGGTGGGLYFIVGGLVVVVGVLAFLFFGGHIGNRGGPAKLDITIQAPAKT